MHIPVLLNEVIEYLEPKPGENFIDCTIGGGGHAIKILEKAFPSGRLLGIDWDHEMLERLSLKLKVPEGQSYGAGKNPKVLNRVILTRGSFANLEKIAQENNFTEVDGILLDLGMSSWHLEKSGRGFSFKKDEPLDMRYNVEKIQNPKSKIQNYNLTAREIVNTWPEREIEKILKEYGERRFAKRIAKAIVNSRKIKPIKTTFQLVDIVKKTVPHKYQHKKIHPATKTFQALRIAVNNELENLKKTLPQAVKLLRPKGSLVVISFHSLEDRIVKDFFRKESKDCICPPEIPVCVCGHKRTLKIITKKPITPSQEEIISNPRARSAKLRVAERIDN